jgi:hypothetical protein
MKNRIDMKCELCNNESATCLIRSEGLLKSGKHISDFSIWWSDTKPIEKCIELHQEEGVSSKYVCRECAKDELLIAKLNTVDRWWVLKYNDELKHFMLFQYKTMIGGRPDGLD